MSEIELIVEIISCIILFGIGWVIGRRLGNWEKASKAMMNRLFKRKKQPRTYTQQEVNKIRADEFAKGKAAGDAKRVVYVPWEKGMSLDAIHGGKKYHQVIYDDYKQLLEATKP